MQSKLQGSKPRVLAGQARSRRKIRFRSIELSDWAACASGDSSLRERTAKELSGGDIFLDLHCSSTCKVCALKSPTSIGCRLPPAHAALTKNFCARVRYAAQIIHSRSLQRCAGYSVSWRSWRACSARCCFSPARERDAVTNASASALHDALRRLHRLGRRAVHGACALPGSAGIEWTESAGSRLCTGYARKVGAWC